MDSQYIIRLKKQISGLQDKYNNVDLDDFEGQEFFKEQIDKKQDELAELYGYADWNNMFIDKPELCNLNPILNSSEKEEERE